MIIITTTNLFHFLDVISLKVKKIIELFPLFFLWIRHKCIHYQKLSYSYFCFYFHATFDSESTTVMGFLKYAVLNCMSFGKYISFYPPLAYIGTQFYIQLVFKAPLSITLTISDQKIESGSLFFQLFQTFSKKKYI